MSGDMLNVSPEQAMEIARCALSSSYFITNYCWLEEKETQRIIPFVPFPYQYKILDNLQSGNSMVINKSRRVGVSWIVAAYAAWLINFRVGINVLFLSKREADAKKLLAKVKFVLNNLAKHDADEIANATKCSWLRGEVYTNNQQQYSIAHRGDDGNIAFESEASSLTTTSEAGRSEGASVIFLDEFAFVKPDDESTWTAIKPTVARGGIWLIGSTPSGAGGVFHRLCEQAKRGENKSYKYLEVHWSEAGITQEQYEAAIEGMEAGKIAQEWELDFIQSGNPVFNATDLAACYKPLDEYPDVAKHLEDYRNSMGAEYYSGVDSALGRVNKRNSLKDYHSWTSMTKTGIQAHAEHNKKPLTDWAGRIATDEVGNQVVIPGMVSKLHKLFPGVLKVEDNGPGETVIHMHSLPNDGRSEIVSSHTDAPTKVRLIQRLITAIESHDITITDLFTYQCLMVFQHGTTPGQYEAPPGYNDDPVISLALANDLRFTYGNMEFSWADGEPQRRMSAVQEKDIISDAPQAPDLLDFSNMRTSEFTSGINAPVPGAPTIRGKHNPWDFRRFQEDLDG